MRRQKLMISHQDLNQFREQYELEKKLAGRLWRASKTERRALYGQVYDEFFQFAKERPNVSHQDEGREAIIRARQKWQLVKRFANQYTTLLEIGAGNLAFAALAAGHVQKVYALEVSPRPQQDHPNLPKNTEILLSPTGLIPLPDESVDVIYSNQVMEHIHPEDAPDELKDIYRVLKKGGVYVCITPNRLSGPHDISKYFDRLATGLHLHEYTAKELCQLLRQAGFSAIRVYAGGRGWYARLPRKLLTLVEKILTVLPYSFVKRLTRCYPMRALLGITAVGLKRRNP